MSLPSQVAALYLAHVANDNTRLVGSQPAAGLVGAVVTLGKAAYGAWAQVVAAATIANPTWLSFITFDSDADDVDAATSTRSLDVEIGSGAAGSEVALVEVAFGITHTKLTAVGEWTTVYPVIGNLRQKISGAPRIASRGATSNCAATLALGVKTKYGTAIGT